MRKIPLQFLSTFIFICLFSFNLFAEETEQTIQTRISSNGHYTVSIESEIKPLRLGKLHAWSAEIKDDNGKPVEGAKIKISGGMPTHNHGFPTEPAMTIQIEPGKYLLEGFKFNMRGPWVIFLDIDANEKSDNVAFDINM